MHFLASYCKIPKDVLVGRSPAFNIHPGNMRLSTLVEAKKKAFNTVKKRCEKRVIAAYMIAQVRSLDPPGRFLQVDAKASEDTSSAAALSRARGKGLSLHPNIMSKVWVKLDESKVIVKVMHKLRDANYNSSKKSLPAAASGYDQMQQTETGIVVTNNISHNDSTSPSETSTKNNTDADGDGFESAAIAAVRGYYQSRQSIRSSLEAPLDPDYYNRLVNILGKDGADEIIKDSVNEALMEAGKDIIEKILSSGRDAKASNGGKKSGSAASQSVLSKKRCPSQSVLSTIRGPKRGPNQNHPMQHEQEQDEKATFNNISPNDTSIMHF